MEQFVENREDRCPVVLLVDTSEAMAKDGRLSLMNGGLHQLKSDILNDPIASLRIEIAIIQYGGSVQVRREFQSALEFDIPYLHPDGTGHLGAAVLNALELIEYRKVAYRQAGVNFYRPLLFILSGSRPSDHWQLAANAARRAENDRKVRIFPVGISDGADFSTLAHFSTSKPIKMMGLQFREMFMWLSTSVARVSRPFTPSMDPIQKKATDGSALSIVETNPYQLSAADGWGVVLHGNEAARQVEFTAQSSGPSQIALPPVEWMAETSGRSPGPASPRGHVEAQSDFPLVFLAYSRADIRVAQRFHADLASCGVLIYRDMAEHRVGDDWRDRIDDALRRASFCLALFSRASCASVEFNREVDFADRSRKVILPVYLEECEPRYHLTRMHQTLLYEDYTRALEDCLAALRSNPRYANRLTSPSRSASSACSKMEVSLSVNQQFAENKEDRCPVVLVLDTSYSMLDQNKIGLLNDGVQQFRDEVLKDPIAALRIEVAVISFGGEQVKVETDFTTALDFQPRVLDADGNTPMGAAMRKALEIVEDRKAVYRSQGVQYFRPWIWLLTDGQPNDDWKDAAAQAKRAEQDRKVTIFAVGVGDDADLGTLSEFCAAKPMKMKGLQFREMFKWLSASLARVSKQKAGSGQQVQLPPTDGWGSTIA